MKKIINDPLQFLKDLEGWKLYLTAFLTGFLYYIGFPPINHETSPFLVFFPFLSFVTLIPLMGFSVRRSLKESLIAVYVFGIAASVTQIYWLSNVNIKGLWILILLGMCVGVFYVALNFLIYGFVFRVLFNLAPKGYLLLYSFFWVGYEYLRTFTEISFPWGLSGYALIPILPVSQLAAITGVYGLSFLVVFGNLAIFHTLFFRRNKDRSRIKKLVLPLFIAVIILVSIWGTLRLNRYKNTGVSRKVALIQSNVDQSNWSGRASLSASLKKSDSLVSLAEEFKPELVVFPESGIYTYLKRDRFASTTVRQWSSRLSAPLLFGTLHTERLKDNPYYKYHVYNSVFFLAGEGDFYEMYHKMRLVPFSEALPFEGLFPILSRVNLGESDFRSGDEETIFKIPGGITAAPYICYEVIYPNFVRRRAALGANLLVVLTNDGWFGKSTAPYLHASMARMRTIETGTPMLRCANSGISFVSDALGRIIKKSDLYRDEVILAELPFFTVKTFYKRFGDWLPFLSIILLIASIMVIVYYRR